MSLEDGIREYLQNSGGEAAEGHPNGGGAGSMDGVRQLAVLLAEEGIPFDLELHLIESWRLNYYGPARPVLPAHYNVDDVTVLTIYSEGRLHRNAGRLVVNGLGWDHEAGVGVREVFEAIKRHWYQR